MRYNKTIIYLSDEEYKLRFAILYLSYEPKVTESPSGR